MVAEKKLVPLLFSHHHQHHAPILETHHAKILNYPEIPRRAEIIREHLFGTGLMQPVLVETPMPKSEIYQTLDAGMVDYLEAISQDLATLTTESLSTFYSLKDTDPAHFYRYPSVFPQRDRIYHSHQSLMGLHGYYCFDKDAPVGKGTWEATLYSATIAHQGAGMILAGQPLAYSLCRPPGHHASRDLMGGYCYLNNAAIAATRLREMGTVAIIDIDYHHGNGTQEIFWNDPHVLFTSIHAHPEGEYPYFTGYAEEIGGPLAPHTNLNFPLHAGATEIVFLAAMDELLAGVRAFNPASIVVSLGFDAFEQDPLGTFKLKAESYFKIAQKITALQLPTLLVQEGGYAVEMLGILAEQFVSGMLSI
ncbi:MAG: histone deacetylase family protein [Chloroflexi bacterium]|nr:histone deacetylase family protein [Chloroflexota bacterium]